MQKVSKQSLAMIALSILLAISIALTFTFAALSDSKTAKGTITFSGEATVVWTGGTPNGGNTTFTLVNADFDVTSTGATLNDTGKAKLGGIKVTIKNTATTELDYSITMTAVSGATINFTEANGTLASNDANNGNVEKTLADLISSISFTTAQMADSVEFTVTASIAPANA